MKTTDPSSGSLDGELAERTKRAAEEIFSQIRRRIVGQQDVVEHLLVALFSGGHALVVGVPGLAKTLLVKTLAQALSLSFGRVQFTPDLMPTDITGTDILEESPDGKRGFRFLEGPLFCNLLLADEINRTPPKTQAALLQAMQENAVTAGARTYPLPRPFNVFATQNPIEQAGTYPLPEAQLDRFMLQVDVDYPESVDEVEIVKRSTSGVEDEITPVMGVEELMELQGLVPRVPVADHVIDYAVRLVRGSRPNEKSAPEEIRRFVSWGAGPRAAQMLVLASKARALVRGGYVVDIEDVRAQAPAVLRHRLVRSFEAEAEGVKANYLVEILLGATSP